MKTLKEVLKNPPILLRSFGYIDYNLWCKQVREAVAHGTPCAECGLPTGRDEVDALYIDDYGPFCLMCYNKELKSIEGKDDKN